MSPLVLAGLATQGVTAQADNTATNSTFTMHVCITFNANPV